MSSHVDDAGVTAEAVTDAALASEVVDVLVVGEALVDIVHRDGEVLEHPGGSPANVALGLGRLGANVTLLTHVGRDERGIRVAAHLAASGVRVSPNSFSDRATSTASAFIGPDGSASYEFDVHWNPRASGLPVRPRIAHTGSIAAFLAPGAGAVRTLLRELDADELTFDPNIRAGLIGTHAEAMPSFEAMASLATVVKLSDEDAAWLYPGRSTRAVLETVRSLGPALVAMTLGAHGSLISVGDEVVEIPAATVDVVDTIGAGDAYMASLIASLLAYPSRSVSAQRAREIGRRASSAAALTVSRAGADLPSAAELQRVLRAQVVEASTSACIGTVMF